MRGEFDEPLILSFTPWHFNVSQQLKYHKGIRNFFPALANLNQMFDIPSNNEEPTHVTRTAWRTDPFTRGCYSYLKVGRYQYKVDPSIDLHWKMFI